MGSSLYSAIDPSSTFFLLSYLSSQVSSALGLANILKNGVARVLVNGGACDGMFTGQFVLVFLACIMPTQLWRDFILSTFIEGNLTKIGTGLLISSIISTQFCFSLFCTIGWSKKSAKTIVNQPTLILLPIFTFFTFSKMSVCCGEKQDVRLKLSTLYSVINLVMKTLIWIPLAVIYFRSSTSSLILLLSIPFYFVGALLTFIYLYSGGGQQLIHVYDPDLPDQEFVFRNGKVIRKDEDIIELEEK